jgi:hypothetical protein
MDQTRMAEKILKINRRQKKVRRPKMRWLEYIKKNIYSK